MPVVVKIDRYGDKRILALVPWFNGEGPKMAKRIDGVSALWDKTGPTDKFIGWSYPLDLEICRQLRTVFGDRLLIGPELREWAEAEREREAGLTEMRSAHSTELPELPELAPRLAEAFVKRPYQPVAVAYGLQSRNFINADEPGLGKTLETLGTLALAGVHRVLVFCRLTAMRPVWERETARWLGDSARTYVATGSKARREEVCDKFNAGYAAEPGLVHVLICNTEMARVKTDWVEDNRYETPAYPGLFAEPWDAIVIDESHNVLIGKSHLSVAVSRSGMKAAKITQGRLGMFRLPLAEGGFKIALSGTPFRGKTINLWGTLNWLDPGRFTSYWRYARQFYEVDDEGSYTGSSVVTSEEVRPDALVAYNRTLAPYVLRRTKAEVAKDLAPKEYMGTPLNPRDESSPRGIWLELTEQQDRVYREMEQDARAQVDEGILVANGSLAELTRLKQLATCYGKMDSNGEFRMTGPSNKLNWIIDFAETHASGSEGKLIIASQFTQVINLFANELFQSGHMSYVITGEVPQSRRNRIVEKFADYDDDVRICMINTRAGGESITLDAADTVILVDETHIPDEQLQVEDRAHRVSRTADRLPVMIYYLRSLGTVEQDIAETGDAREGRCLEVLDGSRGIAVLSRARSRSGVASG
jgi:SNF2 family DNA or RNA helicase